MDTKIILELTNFKGIKSKKLEFPSTGLLLLDGATGVGKSTILDSISFVLYDNMGNSCYNKENKLPLQVEITLMDKIKIRRQRRPKSLTVWFNNCVYQDGKTPGEAQKMIESVLGRYEIWDCGGYLKQGNLNTFFTMNSDERLVFLEKMCLDDMSKKDLYLEKAKEKYKQCLETHTRLIPILESKKNLYNELKEEWNVTFSADDSKLKLSELKELQGKTLEENKKKKEELEQLYEKKVEFFNEQKALFKYYSTLNANQLDLQTELNKIPVVEQDEITFLEKEREVLYLKSQVLIKSNQKKALLLKKQDILSKLENLETGEEYGDLHSILDTCKIPTREQLETEINETETMLNNLDLQEKKIKYNQLKERLELLSNDLASRPIQSSKDRIHELEHKIWLGRLDTFECPVCESKLKFNESKVICVDSYENISVETLEKERKELVLKEKSYEGRDVLLKEIDILKEQLKQYDPKSFQHVPNIAYNKYELNSRVLVLRNQLEKRMKCPIKLEISYVLSLIENRKKEIKYKETLKQVEKELGYLPEQILEEEKTNVQEELAQLTNLIIAKREWYGKRQNIISQYNKLKEQMNSIHLESQEELQEEIGKLKQSLNLLEEKNKQDTDYFDKQIKIRKLKKISIQYNRAQKEYTQNAERLHAFDKIMETIKISEYELIQSVIDIINKESENILDSIFSKPINFKIESVKENKDKNNRPNINYIINLDGMHTKYINDLSGGEKSRVSLALSIIFSRYSKVPILIMDESFSALNIEIREHVIEVLKNNVRNKLLIIVNHEIGKGYFDDVITVN